MRFSASTRGISSLNIPSALHGLRSLAQRGCARVTVCVCVCERVLHIRSAQLISLRAQHPPSSLLPTLYSPLSLTPSPAPSAEVFGQPGVKNRQQQQQQLYDFIGFLLCVPKFKRECPKMLESSLPYSPLHCPRFLFPRFP